MKKYAAILLTVLLVINTFAPVSFAAEEDHVFFADKNDNVGGWNFAAETDTKTVKSGKSSLMIKFTSGDCGVSIPAENAFAVDDKTKAVLQMWIKLPKTGGIPTMMIMMDEGGKNFESRLSIAEYIDSKDRGKWKFLQLPLTLFPSAGQYWSHEKNAFEYTTLTWKNVNSINFIGGTSSGAYIFNVDDLLITSRFNEEDNSQKASSDGNITAVDPLNRTEADGTLTYAEIYSDGMDDISVGMWRNSANYTKADRRDRKFGDDSMHLHWEPSGEYQGATVSMKKPVNFSEELASGAVLDMWVKKHGGSGVSLLVRTKKGQDIKIGLSIADYVYDDDVWTHVVIPLAELKSGIYWTAATGNVSVASDWNMIAGLAFDLGPSSVANDLWFDNVRIIKGDFNAADKPTVRILPEDEYNQVQQNFTMIDISPYVNKELIYDGVSGWIGQTDFFENFNYKGVTEFLNIPFNITDPDQHDGKGVIITRGQNKQDYPTSVTVPIGGKTARGIYFLHTAAWCETNIGDYIVRYTDGSKTRIALKDGNEIGDWGDDMHTNASKTVMKIWNNSGNKYGCFQLFPWANPYPDKPIESIEARTGGAGPFLIVAGITLTDSDPIMLRNEELFKKPRDKEIVNPDTSDWFAYEALPDETIAGTPIDASWVFDGPCGKHGFVKAQGDEYVFEDGTKANFWGANIAANAIFQSKEDTDELVTHAAANGFNLLRFHHMDTDWSNPNIFGTTNSNHGNLPDPVELDKFEYLWAKCKEKGIYIYLDGLCYWYGGMKGEIQFREDRQAQQMEYLEALFTHVNPYTGTTLADDPTFAMMDIVNEDSFAWRDLLTWRFPAGENQAVIRPLFANWLKNKYGTEENVKKAWAQEDRNGWDDNDSLETGVYINPRYYLIKELKTSDQKLYDIQSFFVDISIDYYTKMINFIKNDLGVKALITGSNCPGEMQVLYGDTVYNPDFWDIHTYYNHPAGDIYYLPAGLHTYDDNAFSILENKDRLIAQNGNRTAAGLPMAVSEWANVMPHLFDAESMPLMAAYSDFETWAPMYFTYTQGGQAKNTGLMSVWNMYESPTKRAISAASAIMMIRGDVKKANMSYFEPLDYKTLMSTDIWRTSIPDGMHWIAKTGIALSDIPWSVEAMTHSNEALLDYYRNMEETGVYVSTTGELRYDENQDTFEINTPNSQGYIGYIGGKNGVFDNMDVNVSNIHANVLLTSLTQSSIEDSDRLLLSCVGRWRNSGMKWSESGTDLEDSGGTPMLLEPIKGEITLKTGKDYDVFCLDMNGQRTGSPEKTVNADGSVTIKLTAENKALNYELVKVGETGGNNFEKPQWGRNLNIPVKLYGFSDMQNHWAKIPVTSLLMKSVIDKADSFNPDSYASAREINTWFNRITGDSTAFAGENVTREEMFGTIAKYLHDKDYIDYKQIGGAYSDEAGISPEWLYYLQSLTGNGILKGDNNCFRPKDYVTKAEAACFLSAVADKVNEWGKYYEPYSQINK